MTIKMKDKRKFDIRLILLSIVFIGLPLIIFINWIAKNNEIGMLLKMLIIVISVVVISLIYRCIRCLITVKNDKVEMSFIRYALIQGFSLIITLVIIGVILACISFI